MSSELLAQNTVPSDTVHNTAHEGMAQEAHAAQAAHTAHTEEEEVIPPAKVFDYLIGELGDHHQLTLFNFHVAELPVILVDNGLHYYPSSSAMEQAGMYTMHNPAHLHHPTRVSDGGSPSLDLSITNYVIFEWTAMILLFVVLSIVKGRYKKNPRKAPHGVQNLIEIFVTYIRDEVVRPNIVSERLTKQLLPYFLSLFFFILTLNVIGLLPGGHTATGSVSVTGALAITAFFAINITSVRRIGIKGWLHHLLGGAPVFLAPIMVPIEIIGLFAKPFALAVRLFANMTAGHIVLGALVGLIFFFGTPFVAVVSTPFSIFIYALETLVIFLQAYIFTMLTAVFVGLGLGSHAHDEHEPAAAHH